MSVHRQAMLPPLKGFRIHSVNQETNDVPVALTIRDCSSTCGDFLELCKINRQLKRASFLNTPGFSVGRQVNNVESTKVQG
jgi:hypothetical protein